jgi:hypothetical protein
MKVAYGQKEVIPEQFLLGVYIGSLIVGSAGVL